jgi:hypothetical protein
MELETATRVLEALAPAPQCGIANNNILIVGRSEPPAGTLTGRLPERRGFAGDLQVPWTSPDVGWLGLLPLAPSPLFPAADDANRFASVADPQTALWTANGRILGGQRYLARTGPGRQDFAARSRQI